MIRRQHVAADFFPEAEAMRAAYDEKVGNAYRQAVQWQYFCDPRMYTYLRTTPQQVFALPLWRRFDRHLRQWCMEHAGLMPTGEPNLHMMVNGCTLGLHSDFQNGTLGFVYSLTRWDSRRFAGGETLLMRDGVPSYKKHHVQGEVLYELVPAQFNQLLLFDDRIVHGTPTIQGSMDPLEARIALVGHLRAASPVVTGPLDEAAAREVVAGFHRALAEPLKPFRDVQGVMSLRFAVAAGGGVESVEVLTDNFVTAQSGYEADDEVAAARALVLDAAAKLRFPVAGGPSKLIAPVLLPLPDLRPVEIAVAHAGRPAVLREALKAQLKEVEALGFRIEPQSDDFAVREPLAGTIRIESHRIVASFDAPMWVPSQREQFQAALAEKLGMLARYAG
ncbi:hypothetical protein [Variovorax sp. W6]|uniref:hypothetical protein n=1 Tax=Variovorax sp. W6 TaxID=3093895 RepID=UPI003D8060E2